MAHKTEAKLFKNGRSQAVRLPREYRFEGDRVRVRRTESGVLLEPILTHAADWFAAMDSAGKHAEPIFKAGRRQPPAQRRKPFA